MIKQNTKAQYYQILRDLEEKFHVIQDNRNDGPKYRMYTTNLGQFIKRLIDSKIIPKAYVLQPYKFVFTEALWNINRASDDLKKEPDTKEFIEFCKENNIQEMEPPKWTFQ